MSDIFRVTLTDGTIFDAVPQNPDFVRWDLAASRHGWPKVDDAPFLWMNFVVWSAAKRAGDYDKSFDDFHSEDAVNVEKLDEAPKDEN